MNRLPRVRRTPALLLSFLLAILQILTFSLFFPLSSLSFPLIYPLPLFYSCELRLADTGRTKSKGRVLGASLPSPAMFRTTLERYHHHHLPNFCFYLDFVFLFSFLHLGSHLPDPSPFPKSSSGGGGTVCRRPDIASVCFQKGACAGLVALSLR